MNDARHKATTCLGKKEQNEEESDYVFSSMRGEQSAVVTWRQTRLLDRQHEQQAENRPASSTISGTYYYVSKPKPEGEHHHDTTATNRICCDDKGVTAVFNSTRLPKPWLSIFLTAI